MPFLSPKSSNTGILETKSNKILDRASRLRLICFGCLRGGRGAHPGVQTPLWCWQPRRGPPPARWCPPPAAPSRPRHSGQWARRAAGSGRVAAEGSGGGRGLGPASPNPLLSPPLSSPLFSSLSPPPSLTATLVAAVRKWRLRSRT